MSRAKCSAHLYASVAQLVEQWTENPCVVGSTPTGGTICGCSSSGRARPCQGRGSEFEPRHPLHPNIRNAQAFLIISPVPWPSGKAKVCKTFIPQFKSGRHLHEKEHCGSNALFQRYKSTSWICDMPFGRDIRLRRVICLRAWVDLYHITFLRSRNISQFATANYITSAKPIFH